jgi:hypoxanthine phosphoribosyltransferase|tara:strand:+ start:164 stop:688 length:525 start_codon:yes stop_codon:yes gene_type:complete
MKQLITEKEIDIQSKIIAKQINDKHRDDKTPVVFVGLLNGCFMFYSDFIKNLTFDLECDFMRVKSYVSKRKQGDVQITKDLETAVKGKHVYIVDDIFDTGNTINAVIDYLKVKDPSMISVVTLLKRKNSPSLLVPNSFVDNHYNVIEIDEEWVIGYGLDDDKGHCRNYRTIFEI